MALIDSDSYRVDAYFEETKIPHIKAGASAEIYLMDGTPALQGTVSGISTGITDQDNKDGPESPRFYQSHIHLGATGAADSCPHPNHARATRGVDQRGNDRHRGNKGWRGA